MSNRFLLDTNVLSDLLKNPQGGVTQKIEQVGEDHICTSIIVASELRFGAYKKGSDELTRRVEVILSAIEILPYDSPADSHYAKLRAHLERKGTPIGPNDMLVAAQALALDLVVVTANTKEFRRVPKLKVENWIEAGS